MLRFFREIFCKHNWNWKYNVYGDGINHLDCRSIWECDKCGAWTRGMELMKK